MGAVSSFLRLVHAARLLAGPALAFRAKKPDAGTRLSSALERLGPPYVKLGQMLATRPDIVGAQVATALENLQDRLPPFAEATARAEIVRAFNRPVEALFASFGAALAAASIAQVHRAQTSDTPPVRVAVKILRPEPLPLPPPRSRGGGSRNCRVVLAQSASTTRQQKFPLSHIGRGGKGVRVASRILPAQRAVTKAARRASIWYDKGERSMSAHACPEGR